MAVYTDDIVVSPFSRTATTLATMTLMVVAVSVPAGAGEHHATGLERAREMAAKGLETARGVAAGLDSDRTTGLDRAAEAISAALERGNGNGHAWGRGNSAAVHDIKANGGSPSARGSHGKAVREMVKAYNALRKANR